MRSQDRGPFPTQSGPDRPASWELAQVRPAHWWENP